MAEMADGAGLLAVGDVNTSKFFVRFTPSTG
jgi:hypothetical protein